MKLIYLKPALKCDSFDVAIGIKIPFFRVLVTIEPGRSLLQFVTTNCLIIELCLYNRIVSFLDNFEIINHLQFGFRKCHSTDHAVLLLTQYVHDIPDLG